MHTKEKRKQDAWLGTREAAEYLGIDCKDPVEALRERVARGSIKAHKLGRNLRFRLSELDAAIV